MTLFANGVREQKETNYMLSSQWQRIGVVWALLHGSMTKD